MNFVPGVVSHLQPRAPKSLGLSYKKLHAPCMLFLTACTTVVFQPTPSGTEDSYGSCLYIYIYIYLASAQQLTELTLLLLVCFLF